MDFETLKTLGLWCIALICVVNGLMLDLALGRFLASITHIVQDFISGRFYKPWKTVTPILVSNKKQIAELSEASALSQRAVYADMFGFKHTLNNFSHEEMSIQKFRLSGRLLQVNGVANLPRIFPFLAKRVSASLEAQVERGKASRGGISLPIAETVRTLASRTMAVLFFGEKLADDPTFANALLRHPKDMVSCMMAFQITPSFMSSYVHDFLTKRGEAQHTLLDRVADVIRGRATWNEDSPLKELTFVWNTIELAEGNEYWQGPEHFAQHILGVWFAAAHQPWMNLDFIILQLCFRPDIQDALRSEIGEFDSLTYDQLQNLPFLDSFIKEVVRLHPLDTMAVRRKAMRDYTFNGGAPFCPSGTTVCVSSYDLMHNELDYPNPHQFKPRRFIDTDTKVRGAKFTDVSEKFPVWGYGSLACPGRFHASIVMKLVIASIVTRYTVKLEDEKAKTLWSWETFTMPYESTRFILTERLS